MAGSVGREPQAHAITGPAATTQQPACGGSTRDCGGRGVCLPLAEGGSLLVAAGGWEVASGQAKPSLHLRILSVKPHEQRPGRKAEGVWQGWAQCQLRVTLGGQHRGFALFYWVLVHRTQHRHSVCTFGNGGQRVTSAHMDTTL